MIPCMPPLPKCTSCTCTLSCGRSHVSCKAKAVRTENHLVRCSIFPNALDQFQNWVLQPPWFTVEPELSLLKRNQLTYQVVRKTQELVRYINIGLILSLLCAVLKSIIYFCFISRVLTWVWRKEEAVSRQQHASHEQQGMRHMVIIVHNHHCLLAHLQ